MKQKHIYLYGFFGFEPSDDWAKDLGIVRLQDVVNALKEAPDAEELIVHIHSPGGEVSEGFAIYDALTTSGKKVTTIIEGLCASIATVAALAGSTRKITKNAEFMIHNPWGFAGGDADQLQKYTDDVKKAEEKLINLYNAKTGIEKEELDRLMKEETFMTAEQALELKFVTEIIEPVTAKKKERVYAFFKPTNSPNMGKLKKENEDSKGLLDNLKAVYEKVMGKKFVEQPPVKALDLAIDGGGMLHVDTEETEPKVGDVCSVDGQPTPDKEYKMADGKTIKTDAESKITEIVPAEEPAAEDVVNIGGKEYKMEASFVKVLKAELAKKAEAKDTETEKEISEIKATLASITAIAGELSKKNSKPLNVQVTPVLNKTENGGDGETSKTAGLKERVVAKNKEKREKVNA